MTRHIFAFESPFLTKSKKHHWGIFLHTEENFKEFLGKQKTSALKNQAAAQGFTAKAGQVFCEYTASGTIKSIHAGGSGAPDFYDGARIAESIMRALPAATLKSTSFEIKNFKSAIKQNDRDNFFLSWALAGYAFTAFKKPADSINHAPFICLPDGVNKSRILSMAKAIFMLRHLVNTPANHLGPAELEKAASQVAKTFTADMTVIKDKDLIKQNFPLIYTVGEAASDNRRPRLIDIKWGNPKYPAVTLVGKGVCYDTGGLNLKPGPYMKNMKKDMGGAAHALAVGYMVMAMKSPVSLRILIPAVENSVAGAAFRPGDIIKSRKGVFVENTNTDAEGRLILADTLTYAAESKPELIIDFATLTGSARAALGPDIPAMFSNNDKTAEKLQSVSWAVQDQLWRMPLWQPYRKVMASTAADMVNSANPPGDLIYSALFLEGFLPDKNPPDWVHLDIYSWTDSGGTGRGKDGTDTSARAVFAFLEDRYG